MTTETPESPHIWYPVNDVFAVIDSRERTDAAVADLLKAGFHAEDIEVFHGTEAVERIDATGAHCGLLLHIARFLWSYLTEEGNILAEYQEEGLAGHHILAVHTHHPEQVEQAHRILAAHQGYYIKYFGHWDMVGMEA